MPRPVFLAALLLSAPVSLLAGLLFGSADLSLPDILRALLGEPGLTADIVWQLRLPRVASAFACGGLLALAGVMLQVLLRNPLADPYILGISGGAAVGALTAMLLGLAAAGVDLAALAGAVGAVALVFSLSVSAAGWNMHRLLLTGVVLSAGFGALISLILTLAPMAGVRGMLFWLMGDLSHASSPGLAWAVMLAALGFGLWQAKGLDVLSLGELQAKALGVAVGPLQYGIYFAASAVTAVAVLEGGPIGFVGLIIPHLVRLLGVAGHRWLLPFSLLAGGSFLTLADTLSRAVAAPRQLPVGVLTALLGVPMLLFLLRRR
jgi:iron complex transport system permease protein